MTFSFPSFPNPRSIQKHLSFKGFHYGWVPFVAMALTLGLFNPFMNLLLPQASATNYPVSILPTENIARPAVSIFKGIKVAPDYARVDLNLRNTSIVDILQLLAEQGHFNIIVDESVTGVMTVDIKNISVNKALEYIFITGGLSYTQEGNTLVVANTATTNARSLNAKIFKVIPIKYTDAGQISTRLNQTIFAANKPGTNNMAVATFDPNTNSLLVVATDREVALIEELLPQLDLPRNRKVFKIMHGNANTIALNVFTTLTAGWADNAAGTSTGGGGAAAGGGGAAAGGGGAAAGGGGAAAGGGGGAAAGGGGAAAAGGGGTYARGGFSMVPNQATGTVTVYGTPEQLQLVEELIHELDVARPQVMIELSLIELTKSNTKVIQPITTGPIGFGEFQIATFTGSPFTYGGKALGILGGGSGNGSVGKFQLPNIGFNFNNNDTKAKILANPTLIAVDGTTSSVSITDTIVYFTSQITIPAAGGVPVVTWTANSQEVGIKLELTPVLHNDGNVTMALKPSVSQLIALKQGGNGAVSAPEIAKREFSIASARVKDGQTLAIGGLLRDTRNESWDKIPGLANLPIVGAMFRSTTSAGNQTQRTELVVLVTPHILKEEVNSPYFDGDPKPASDSDALTVPQHGRTGTPLVPSEVKVMGYKGGELKIETGRLVMPEPQASKSSEKLEKSVKRKQAKMEDPYSVTPYNDYIGGLNRNFGSNFK
jgi:type II secretory pathway component GspD/PulD (secretin)